VAGTPVAALLVMIRLGLPFTRKKQLDKLDLGR
jgi:hypothetical protein